MKTKKEIIEETKIYYSEDVSRRAINTVCGEESGCEYLTEDGRMCAVGRCFIEEGLFLYGTSSSYFLEKMIDYFKDEYKIYDVEFWISLQKFHDESTFWDSEGLTSNGINYYEELLRKYGEE